MQKIDLLIQMNKNRLNEYKQTVNKLEEQKIIALDQIKSLADELIYEQKHAQDNFDLMSFFAAYAAENLDKQNGYRKNIENLDIQIAACQDEILKLFIEVKKFDVYKTNILAKLDYKEKKKNIVRLDEVSMRIFMQKNLKKKIK